MNNPADARLALLALAAESMYTLPSILAPALDPYAVANGYTLCAHITAIDAVRDLPKGWAMSPAIEALRVFYGFVARRPGDGSYLVSIRGTERFVEWVIDAEFDQVEHPVAGLAEHGFWSVYTTMRLRTLEGEDQEFVPGLAGIFGPSAKVSVVGHSLGAALATYAALDVARLPGTEVTARVFASPRAGNKVFTQCVDETVADCRAYAYERDLVPKVPFALGYSPLGSLVELPANPAIRDNPLANHHCANYAWLIDQATGAPFAQLPAA